MQGYRVYDPSGVSSTLCGEAGGIGAKTGLYLVDQSLTKPKITEQARCLTARYTSGVVNRSASNSGVLEITEAHAVLTPDRLEKRQNGRRMKEADEPMFTLTSQDRHGVLLAVDEGDGDNTGADQETAEKHTPSIKVRSGVTCGYETAQPGDSVDLAYPNSETRRARVGKGIAHNLSCGGRMGVAVWNGKMVRIRRLTPRECFRLQGFPDGLFEKAAAVNSDAQLYKQAGNGVTVNVVAVIGRAILASYE